MPILSQDRGPPLNAVAGIAHIAFACLAVTLWLAWQAIRLPLLAFLVILEPLVRFLLSALALLITLTALLWAFAEPARFPFWTVLAGSLACVLVLALYHSLMRVLSGGATFSACDSRPGARR